MPDKPDYPKGLHANTAYEFLVRGLGFLKAEAERYGVDEEFDPNNPLDAAIWQLENAVTFTNEYLKNTEFDAPVINTSKPIEGTPYEGKSAE